MRWVFDVLLAGWIGLVGCLVLLPLGAWLRWRRRRGPRRIVYLGTGQIAQVFPRNGVNLFLERECSDFGGYFEQMWNVHFPAGARGALSLTPRHHLIDVDFPVSPGLSRFRAASMAWREIRFLGWLLPFLVRNRATMVTATNPYLQGLNAALAGRLLGLPYAVIITRDYDWDWAVLGKQAFASIYPTRRLERAIGRWVLRHANLVLADREYYRQFAIRNGAAPERAIATRILADSAYAAAASAPPASSATDGSAAAGSATDGSAAAGSATDGSAAAGSATDGSAAAGSATVEVRARYGLGAGPLLCYVGRLDADKFPLDLVECLGLVQRHVPDVVLACAGTGAMTEQMRQCAAELGVAEHLRLLGVLDLAELPALLAASNVFVAPHTGYTLIEAGLTGVPVVTYDYDFHAEIVADGQTGYLAPLRDVAALADRVCRLLDDPDAARAMGARLRTQLLRDHSLAAVVPLYRQAYDQVLGSAR